MPLALALAKGTELVSILGYNLQDRAKIVQAVSGGFKEILHCTTSFLVKYHPKEQCLPPSLVYYISLIVCHQVLFYMAPLFMPKVTLSNVHLLVKQNARHSNRYDVAVVDLVLDDLRWKAGASFEPCLKLLVLVLHLDCSIQFSLSPSSNSIIAVEYREIGFRFLVKAFP